MAVKGMTGLPESPALRLEPGIPAALFPPTLDEALRSRAEGSVIPYAGGTDLMVKYRRSSGCLPAFDRPLLFIGRLRELRGIFAAPDGSLRIGAGTTLTELLADPAVPGILKAAAGEMAAPAVRNTATLGGNICNASPAGDALPPLYVLEARVALASVRGRRILAIEEFIQGPGKTRLESDELLIEVLIPPLPSGTRWACRKVGTRRAQALAKVSIAAVALVTAAAGGAAGGVVRDSSFRIALGAVGPTVFRSAELEARLAAAGGAVRGETVAETAAVYAETVVPIDDQRSTAEYRRRTCSGLVEWAAGECGLRFRK